MISGPMAPLFLTRKYPPSVGGMQTLAAGVWRALQRRAPQAQIISHGGSNRELPRWLVGALPRATFAIARRRVDSVLTGDALMYAISRPILMTAGLPQATMIMGLDITYTNPMYRALVHPAVRGAPRLIAISSATADAAVSIGVKRERISVVRLGIPTPEVTPKERRAAGAAIRRAFGLDRDDVVLLTLGRLVRRKGVDWFLKRVLPHLPAQVKYLVAGDGPLESELRRLSSDPALAGRVHILGGVDDERREQLLRGADLFVQPNVRVSGDMEGFGLVVLEAATRGTPTLASGLEGIVDAVVDGQTGVLLPTEDEAAWVDRITELVASPDQLRALGAQFGDAARQLYGEEQMGDELLRLLS